MQKSRGAFLHIKNSYLPPNNRDVLNISNISNKVMISTSKAEIEDMFINACKKLPERETIQRMWYKQLWTHTQTDNSAAHVVTTNNVQSKRTKSMYVCFHWFCNRKSQCRFRYYWRPGTKNYSEYWTKHHLEVHQKSMWLEVLTSKSILKSMIKSLGVM